MSGRRCPHVPALLVSAAVTVGVLAGVAPASADTPLPGFHSSTPFTVTRGVTEHAEIYDVTGGHERAQVLDLDLSDRNVGVDMVESHDRITDPTNEKVTSMGTRTGAVAGVNGDFFDISHIGSPRGGLIRSGHILRSPRHDYNAQVGVRPDGSLVLGPQQFSATVADGKATHPVNSINVIEDAAVGQITRVTPDLGAVSELPVPYQPGQLGGPLPTSTLVVGHDSRGVLVVDSVNTRATAVPQLAAGQDGLLASGDGARWLRSTIHPGDRLRITQRALPVTGLISGATMLVRNGRAYDDPTGEPPGGDHPSRNPETIVGASKDGKRAYLVTIDGHDDPAAVGVSPAEATDYMLAHHVDSAVLFDGGGSTEMAARRPGDTGLSIINRPSDAEGERNVANGIFVYSRHARPGPATQVVVNDGHDLTTVDSGSTPLPVYARDAYDNPAAGRIKVRITPADLATYADGAVIPRRSGTGTITATAGNATSTQRLRVVHTLDTLTVAPGTADLDNGGTQQLTLAGTAGGRVVTVPGNAARWTVDPAALGTVSRDGLFTAAGSGAGTARVSAAVGGQAATAALTVSQLTRSLSTLDDASAWSLRNDTGQPAALTTAAGDVPPGSTATASLRLQYGLPALSRAALTLTPSAPIPVPANAQGTASNAVGLWFKDDDHVLHYAIEFVGADGKVVTSAVGGFRYEGWRFFSVAVPAGLTAPFSVRSIDVLGAGFAGDVTGTVNLSGLTATYPPPTH